MNKLQLSNKAFGIACAVFIVLVFLAVVPVVKTEECVIYNRTSPGENVQEVKLRPCERTVSVAKYGYEKYAYRNTPYLEHDTQIELFE